MSPTNIKALRRLYDKIEFQVCSLKSLGVPLDSYGNLLSSLFMTRLPQEFRLIVSREIGEAEWTVDQIMRIVEGEIGMVHANVHLHRQAHMHMEQVQDYLLSQQ